MNLNKNADEIKQKTCHMFFMWNHSINLSIRKRFSFLFLDTESKFTWACFLHKPNISCVRTPFLPAICSTKLNYSWPSLPSSPDIPTENAQGGFHSSEQRNCLIISFRHTWSWISAYTHMSYKNLLPLAGTHTLEPQHPAAAAHLIWKRCTEWETVLIKDVGSWRASHAGAVPPLWLRWVKQQVE